MRKNISNACKPSKFWLRLENSIDPDKLINTNHIILAQLLSVARK